MLLIGWDAADWKVIGPLLDEGLMPTLDSFVNQGVMGNLASLRPMFSPMLWNSIATGMRPEKHGVFGFLEPDPHCGGVRPVASTSRKVKAIWNILTQRGMKAHVVGWFAGHPAEPVNGVSVSDLFPYSTAPLNQPWPLPEGAVHPESLRETFANLRMHPGEVQEVAILPIIPRAAEVDQDNDPRLNTFAKILAENCSIHNCATWILQHREWDFAAVFYNGIDHFCHAFMDFHPPQRESVPKDLFDIYSGVVNGAYRFHDMLLGRLLQLVPPQTTVILVSDHGFYSDHLRPRAIPNESSGPTVQHRPLGIFAMRGPGVLKDERIYGASLLDITPTILSIFGLPVGRDMDGRVLVQAFESPSKVEQIESWEKAPGDCGMHPSEMHLDAAASKALIDQFVALGYVQQEENQQQAVAFAVRDLQFNRALSLMHARETEKAAGILEQLWVEWPDFGRIRDKLASCYLTLGRRAEAKKLVLDGLGAPMYSGEPSTRPVSHARLDWMLAVILHEDGNLQSALRHLLRAEEANPNLPNLHNLLGGTYLAIDRVSDAERAYLRALEIDGDSATAHLGLARVYLRQRKNRQAAENAFIAVGLQHASPAGHFALGLALARLGHFDRAAVALETAVSMAPGMLNAHRFLAAIHARPQGDKSKAGHHRDMAAQLSIQRRRNRTMR